jgi:dTMP kinase
MTPLAELMLYNASRAQHLEEVILPAIGRGAIVVTDRFTDSTISYQGYGRGIDLNLIDSIDRIVTKNMRPALTVLLDLDVEIGLKRNRGINKTDRLELEDVEFINARSAYLDLAAREPERIKLINASENIEAIHNKIVNTVKGYIY